MLNLNSTLVFSEQPQKLADFYQKIFGKKPDWSEGSCFGFKVGQGIFTTCPHKKIGAKVVAEPYGPEEDPKAQIATLADPDNNYFQLVTPWEMK
jgi:hypothetical protein